MPLTESKKPRATAHGDTIPARSERVAARKRRTKQRRQTSENGRIRLIFILLGALRPQAHTGLTDIWPMQNIVGHGLWRVNNNVSREIGGDYSAACLRACSNRKFSVFSVRMRLARRP